eukprot:SAG31_NODE_10932_length_1082_cov_1.076297_2_plen_70_part_01
MYEHLSELEIQQQQRLRAEQLCAWAKISHTRLGVRAPSICVGNQSHQLPLVILQLVSQHVDASADPSLLR